MGYFINKPHFCLNDQDKWRNLGISTGLQGSKDRDRVSSLTITYGPISSAQNSNSAASLAENDVTCDSSRIPPDGITAQRCVFFLLLFLAYYLTFGLNFLSFGTWQWSINFYRYAFLC